MEALGGSCTSVGMLGAWKHPWPQFLLLWMTIMGVSSLRLAISPDHLDGGVSGAVFRVLCLSDEPLTHCHFKWRDIYNNDGPLMDLSEGPDTPVATNYSYSGTGLDKGQCGVALNRPTGVQRWVVGCRVRSVNSGWNYAQMTLFAHLNSATAVTQSPRVVTVAQGANASLSCNARNALLGCRFRLPNGSLFPIRPPGLSNGACGIAITDVTDDLNGFTWCRAWRSGYDEWRAFAVVVASPPSAPVLEVRTPANAPGDVLKLSCSVSLALPTANMTWYLDDKIARHDHNNEARGDTAWRWPFERQRIMQTFTRRLEAGDEGRSVACGVRQWEGEGPGVRSQYTIAFHREPSPPFVTLTIPPGTFSEGDTLTATCTLTSGRPPANVSWSLGSDVLASSSVESVADAVIETLNVTLTGDADAKQIACVVRLPGVAQPIRRVATLDVQHPPQMSQRPREQLRFRVGSPGVAILEFRANPRPSIYWTVGQVLVQEGFADLTGRFEAAFMVKNVNDPGGWVAKLFINNVTLGDLETYFFLNARNKLGEEFFRAVNFSTTMLADVLAPPTLTLSSSDDYFPVGASIKAICAVTSVRPVATITWTFSNRIITEGVSQPVLTQIRADKHTIVRSVTLRVGKADDGSQLACHAGRQTTSLNISIMYPPKEFTPVIEQYGFEVGKPGVISVEITANPQPTVKWEIAGISIQGEEFDSSRRFHAAQALAKTRGLWVAKLFVTNITQQDIGSVIKLTALNRAGSTTYRVALSTSRPPVETTRLPDSTRPAETTMVTVDESAVYEDVYTETEADDQVTSNYPMSTESVEYGQAKSQKTTYVVQKNDFSYRYLGIANTIAILIIVFVATVVYIRLLRRLSRAGQGFDMDRAPIYMDNIYYDQMHGTRAQCTPATNQQDNMGCE